MGRVVGEGGEYPFQPGREGLDGPGGEQVGPVMQAQGQGVGVVDGQGERVVGTVLNGAVDHAEFLCRLLDPVDVHGEVLEDHRGVEQLAGTGQALDLGQAEELVRHQVRLLVLQAGQDVEQGVGAGGADPHGQGVDEQADHPLDAG